MNFGFSEEQKLLRTEVRNLGESPEAEVLAQALVDVTHRMLAA